MDKNKLILIRFGKSVMGTGIDWTDYGAPAKVRAEQCRKVQRTIDTIESLLPFVIDLFGEDTCIAEQNLLDRDAEKILLEVPTFINHYTTKLMDKGFTVVAIEIEDNELAEAIAARVIRGPRIFLSKRDDDGLFVGYRELK